MFSPLKPRDHRSRALVTLSILIHGTLLGILASVRFGPTVFPKPVPKLQFVLGKHGLTTRIVAPRGELETLGIVGVAPKPKSLVRSLLKRSAAERAHADHRPQRDAKPAETRSGTSFGLFDKGVIAQHISKPALPREFPDVPRQGLPQNINGNFIVEVTIDEEGKVIQTRVVESVAPAVDDRVIATVEHWRFTPATVDGIPIVSKQDLYFHFPR